MTEHTEDENKALNNYFLALRKAWISFDTALPYKHWLIEVTSNPSSGEQESVVRPISNNAGGDHLWTHWRPITMSCESIHDMTQDEEEREWMNS